MLLFSSSIKEAVWSMLQRDFGAVAFLASIELLGVDHGGSAI